MTGLGFMPTPRMLGGTSTVGLCPVPLSAGEVRQNGVVESRASRVRAHIICVFAWGDRLPVSSACRIEGDPGGL